MQAVFLLPFFFTPEIVAQNKYGFLSKEFHRENRERLRALLPTHSLVVFFAAEIKNRNGDVSFPYRQESSFLYLTGLNEPNAVLLISKDTLQIDGKLTSEILFLKETSEKESLWHGKRLQPQATNREIGLFYAISKARFPSLIFDTLFQKDGSLNVFTNQPENAYSFEQSVIPAKQREFQHALSGKGMLVKDASHFVSALRVVKQPVEIDMILKATNAAVMAHKQAIKSCTPGMYEYELTALAEYVFKKEGCLFPAYSPIVASGKNALILHYDRSTKRIEDGELVLMDMAGEFQGYASDVTRTIPANGKFSAPQLALYRLVLAAHNAALQACHEGNNFTEPHRQATEVLTNGLMKLGIIRKPEECKRYFMHGASHTVGLDVHDAPITVLEKGNVITIEPGLYISENSPCDKKYWNIGIRLEDVVMITDEAPFVLSDALPLQPEAIETMMQETGLGNLPIK